MDFIFDHFEIVFFVGLALASWLKRRADSKAEQSAEEEARREVVEQEYEVGEEWSAPQPFVPPPLPEQATPPPFPAPPPLYQPEPEPVAATSGAFGGMEEVLHQQQRIEEQLRTIKQARKARTAKLADHVDRAIPAAGARGMRPVGSLGKALRNRSQIRQAIVLREILGPPVGLSR